MKLSCIFISFLLSLQAFAQDVPPSIEGDINVDWSKYEGSRETYTPLDRFPPSLPLIETDPSILRMAPPPSVEELRTLSVFDINSLTTIRKSKPLSIDYSSLGLSSSLTGIQSWSLQDCPYNFNFGSNNLSDLMQEWTSGQQCFQVVAPRAPVRERIGRDVNACKCMLNDRNNMVAYAMQNKTAWVDNLGTLEQTVEYNKQRLENMRSGLLLQASLLCNSPEEAKKVNPLFNNMSTEMSGVLDNYVRRAKAQINNLASDTDARNTPETQARIRSLAGKLEVPPADENLLTRGFQQDANDCVSVKEYLAFNQLPTYPQFYNTLATENFDPKNWDLKYLENEINKVLQTGGGPHSDQYWNLRDRIRFLQRNGLWRAVFSAADSPENNRRKEDLFNIIKTSFANPRCDAGSCRSDLMSSPKYDAYREASRRFLGRDDVAQMINTSEVDRAKVEFSETAANNIMTRPQLPSTLDAYRQYMARFNSHLSQCDDPKKASLCMFAYAQYCPEITSIANQLQSDSAALTESDFELESMANTEMDPEKNPGYQEFRDAICGPRASLRLGSRGTMANFGAFRESYCAGNARTTKPECAPGDQARRALVAVYIQSYPRPGSSRRNKISKDDRAFAAFLGELRQNNSDLSNADARTAASTSIPVGRVGEVAHRNFSNLGTNSDFSYSSRMSSRPDLAGTRLAAGPASSPSTSTNSSSVQSQTSQSFSRGFVSSDPSSLNAANVIIPASPRTETLRSQVKQSETEVQGIRDQLTGLRSDIEREKSVPAPEQKNGVIQSLNERLADLERRLADKEKERDDLNRRLLASQEQDRSRASRTIASEDDQEGPRSKFLPDSQSQNSTASSSQLQNSQASIQAPVGPASLGAGGSLGGSSLTAPRTLSDTSRSGGGTSGGELLRAKYNIEPGSDQAAGIVIAQTSSGFNYQQLQADSAGNVITVPLSSAEFQNLSPSEQQQYMAQMDPNKSVYRFAFSDGERFLVRNGNQFQVVPVEASPERAPASVPERSIRLEDLNNDLRTSR